MKIYIRSSACISPQNTFESDTFLDEIEVYNGNRLNAIEPDYSEYIDHKSIRRMSRVIRMSVASALQCLSKAEITDPDAIITGTAYGCLEDTGSFLTNMVVMDEDPLSPISFVQSTHNTIGAQIALLLKNHSYNNTFVSGGVSFENTLLDAIMLLNEENNNVLVGGMDEITDMSHAILTRYGLYKREVISNIDLFNSNSKGTIGGEGAAFFMLTNTPAQDNLACIDAASTFYKPADIVETEQQITSFLISQGIKTSDIDLLITGNNGNLINDDIYTQLQKTVFEGIPSCNYKHLCGEYPTSTAFALWVGANIIKQNKIPALLNIKPTDSKINKVLIFNHYQNVHYSLILLSAC
jgi:3-oxoacyl-[acyl-carrier-protein] synthase II